MSILKHNSVLTASWLLGTQRDSLALACKFGLELKSTTEQKLRYAAERVLRGIPKLVTTAIKKLEIDPVLEKVTCCRKCFATYNPADTNVFCTYARFTETSEEQVTTNEPSIDPDLRTKIAACGEPLMKQTPNGLKAIRYYAYQSLIDWIGRLLLREGMEATLDESRQTSRALFDPNGSINDIHVSFTWKTFKAPDGSQFTARSGNLTFGLFVNGC